jgi:hypothetical protein
MDLICGEKAPRRLNHFVHPGTLTVRDPTRNPSSMTVPATLQDQGPTGVRLDPRCGEGGKQRPHGKGETL